MTEAFIRITGLKKYFQMGATTVRALDGIDLEIAPNTFTVVMGPSGSGKSTLLYLLGGLDRPSAGQIEINSQRLDQMDENQLAAFRRRAVGFIFQSFNLIQSMTAAENVAFPMQFAGVIARERGLRSLELLRRVGLQDRGHHRPTELSGGQQQRVAIARALVNDPLLVLADEPTGNLDTASGVSIMHLLSELHRGGRTVLVVTHDQRMIHFATQCIYLLDGRAVNEDEYRAALSGSFDVA
jgi:putative ABC transport system ATP-binding protein